MNNSSDSFIYTEKIQPLAPNSRLLWRGTLINQHGSRLHGLAIVAHAINCKSEPEYEHDPLAPGGGYHSQGLKDLCLEIEMSRGRDFHIEKLIHIHQESKPDDLLLDLEEQMGSRKSRVASLLKGKGNGSRDANRGIKFSDIDLEPTVRLYVDPRCSHSYNSILAQIGKRELNSDGVTNNALIFKLDPVGFDNRPSQLVIFGRAVGAMEEMTEPSTSDTIIPLELVIGLHKPKRNRPVSRPDDPMPRVLPSSLPTTSRSNKFRNIRSLTKSTSTISSQSAHTSLARSLSESKQFRKTQATRLDTLNNQLPNSNKRNVRAIKRPANTPGRRSKPETDFFPGEESDVKNGLSEDLECASPRRSEKRKSVNISSHSTKKVKTAMKTTKRGSQFHDPYAHMEEVGREIEPGEMDSENDFPVDRSPSPSPSPFRYQPNPAHGSNPTPNQSHQPNDLLPNSPGTSKSTRVRFLAPNHIPSKSQNSSAAPNSREKLSPHLIPTTNHPSSSSYLHQNKTLIRKIASESLNNRGIFKHHSHFKDLFAAVCRGVQFALREALEKQSIDINLTKTFVESHLAMYMILNNSNSNNNNNNNN